MLANCWCGNNYDRKDIHWKSWNYMGRVNSTGGLRFKDVESFNLALQAKHSWRFLHDLASLVARVYKEKYLKKENIMEAKLGTSPSLIWRSVWMAKDLWKYGLIFRVGMENKLIYGDKNSCQSHQAIVFNL